MLLLTETKGSCAHMLIITTWLLDQSTCKLNKPVPSDLPSQLQVTSKATR